MKLRGIFSIGVLLILFPFALIMAAIPCNQCKDTLKVCGGGCMSNATANSTASNKCLDQCAATIDNCYKTCDEIQTEPSLYTPIPKDLPP